MKGTMTDATPHTYEVTKRAYGKGHVYSIDGEKVERVTNIVRDIVAKGSGFDRWLRLDTVKGFQRLIAETPDADYRTQPPWEVMRSFPRDRSPLERGTAVHEAIEHGNFDPAEHHPEDQGYVRAAAAFHDANDLKAEAQELIVGSKQYRYAGTLDWRGSLNGESVLLDWKTFTRDGGKPYESYYLQLAAYETASLEMGYEPTSNQFIVALYPSGDYSLFPNLARPGDWIDAIGWYSQLVDLRERMAA